MSVSLTHINVTRKWIAGLVLTVLVSSSFLMNPEPASSSTLVSVQVAIQDEQGDPIDDMTLEVCNQGTGEWQCDRTEPSENGQVTISESLPSRSGFIQMSAGGYPSIYSQNWQGVSFENGVANWQPVITLWEATWITASVEVVDTQNFRIPEGAQSRSDTAANWTAINEVLTDGEFGRESDTQKVKRGNGTSRWTDLPYQGRAIANEWIQVSTQMGDGQNSWTMREWQPTNGSGFATFHLDAIRWGSNPVIAQVGSEGWSSYQSAQSTMRIQGRTGSARITTQSLKYTLTGNVKDETGANMANRELCLFYTHRTTNKRVELDFLTDSSGNYSIENVGHTFVNFEPNACGYVDELLLMTTRTGTT
jgi:hypothetical protein